MRDDWAPLRPSSQSSILVELRTLIGVSRLESHALEPDAQLQSISEGSMAIHSGTRRRDESCAKRSQIRNPSALPPEARSSCASVMSEPV